MMRDVMICKRILLQFVQSNRFVSEDRVEAYHVALMKDRGYVDAQIDCDEEGRPVKAIIGRMTAIGHDAYEKELMADSVENQRNDTSREKYLEGLRGNKERNEFERDGILRTISTGGISLLFAIAAYLKRASLPLPMMSWWLTLVFWGLILVEMMVSAHLAGRSTDYVCKHFYDTDRDVCVDENIYDKTANLLNVAGCVFAILGLVSFARFIVAVA